MLAWSEETITDVRKPEIMNLWRHCRRRAIYWLLRSPSQTCHANKTQINEGAGPLLLSVGPGCLPQAAWLKALWRQDAVALQQMERGALPMIDRGDIRQAIDRCSNIWASCRALVMVSSKSIRLTAWLQNSKKRAEQVIDVWAESPRLSPLWLSSSSACHGLLIITVITPLPTKPNKQKCQKLKRLNAAKCNMQMRQRDVAALDAKYTKELADAKAENDALRDDAAAGRRVCIKQSVDQCTWNHHRLRRG